MIQLILFNVTNGLIIGAFYVLMALGLSLILNLSNVINFAHGNFLALGGYLAFMLVPVTGYWGALLISPLLAAAIGVVLERLMIRRVYGRDPRLQPAAHVRACLCHAGRGAMYWGPNPLQFDMPEFLSAPLSSSLFFITWYRVFMVAIVIATVAGLFCFPALYARRPAHPRGHPRPRNGGGARRQRQPAAHLQLRPRLPARRASAACSPPARSVSIPIWAMTC